MKKLFKKLSSINQETKIGITIATLAVFFFGLIGISQRWWQPTDPKISSTPLSAPISNSNTPSSTPGTSSSTTSSSSNKPVASPLDEIIGYPCATNVPVVRYFFEPTDGIEKQEASVVFFQGKYLPSQGIDFAMDDNTKFSVIASATGEVVSKREDAKYGLTVTILSANNLKFVYSSLSSANVSVGQEVVKGTLLGYAGESAFGTDLGKNHLHLEVFVEETVKNPEKCFTKSVGEVTS